MKYIKGLYNSSLLCITSFYIIQNFNTTFMYRKLFLIMGIIIGAYCMGVSFKYKELKTLKQKQTKWFMLLGVWSLLSLGITGDTRLIVLLFATLVYGQMEHNDIVKSILIIRTFWLILGICLLEGFTHRNTLSMYITTTMLLYLILYNKGVKGNCIIIGLITTFNVCITRSSMALVVSLVFVILLILSERNYKEYIFKVLTCIYPIMFFLNIFLSYIWLYLNDNRLLIFINELSGSRIELGAYSLTKLGYSLFGGNVDYSKLGDNLGYFNIDSGYLWLLQQQGIILSILFLVSITYIVKRMYVTQQKLLFYSLVAMAVLIFAEDVLLSVHFNCFLPLAANQLFRRNSC